MHPDKVNWVYLVRDLLSQLGFHCVWLQQGVGNEHAFLSEVPQRLNDNFIQNWSSLIHDSSRVLSYKHISIFSFNPYLEFVTVKKFRIALSRLSMSSHRLAIESVVGQNPLENLWRNGYVICVTFWKMSVTLF